MSTPITYASTQQFVGIAAEAVQGTAVAMTATQLLTTFTPGDTPSWLKDQSWRGSMGTDAFAHIQGTKIAGISLGGPVYGDTLGFWLRNILGDVSVVGTPTGSGATTLAASAAAGATSFQATATIPNGTLLQVGTGATAEVVTTGTPTGSGPFVIPITTPTGGLLYAHASSQALTPVTGPYTYAWSLLNSGGGQPASHTLTHKLGTTATVGARSYPGFCMSQMNFTFNAESELFSWTGQGTSYPSAPASVAPTANPTGILPIASWQTKVGIGGPASGGTLVNTVTDGEIDITRELLPIFTATGSQLPYIIQRGGVAVTGKLNFGAVSDESALLYMLNNTKPQVQIVCSNGLSGANLISIQIDIQVAAFTAATPDTSKAAVGYQDSFETDFNTTNAGGSGGMSPIKVSVTCNVPPGSF